MARRRGPRALPPEVADHVENVAAPPRELDSHDGRPVARQQVMARRLDAHSARADDLDRVAAGLQPPLWIGAKYHHLAPQAIDVRFNGDYLRAGRPLRPA